MTARRLTIAVIALALLVSLGTSTAIGFFSKPPSYDWPTAVGTGTAIATLMLALATVWLALEAREEREHSRKLLMIQERDEARKDEAWVSVRKALVAYKPGASGPNGAITDVELVNAGHGPAINVSVSLEVWGSRERGSSKTAIGVKTIPLIMPMSTEAVRIQPTPDVSFNFTGDVSSLTCVNVQYRDKPSISGSFREAEPFWEITNAILRGGDSQTSEIVAISPPGSGRKSNVRSIDLDGEPLTMRPDTGNPGTAEQAHSVFVRSVGEQNG